MLSKVENSIQNHDNFNDQRIGVPESCGIGRAF
jgi:hypothetical protein